ncbi:MAG: hypothetical protein EP329_20530 [Deltaproteobacteria bacterium]|nr:MAG: hypothetical protein EP329_20530 [Deltaproteobacteria bacterium]
MGRTIAILLVLTLLSGCRERDPEEVAESFVGALEAYRDRPRTANLEYAWKLLDETSQAPFAERAKAASAALGVKVEPWTMMSYDGLVRGDRLLHVEALAVEDGRARVAVSYGWAVPKEAGGPAEEPKPRELALVQTDDGWKVELPLGAPEKPTAPAGGAEAAP